jgi:hypothetical protein
VGSLVRSLPALVFFVMVAIPLAMAALAIFVALRTRSRVALMAATPTSQVAMARSGRCELSGRAEALEGVALRAPLTQAECCWWSAKLEQFVPAPSGSSASGTWKTLREATSDEPFLLRDASGACVVLPDGAEVTATDHSLWHGRSPVPEDRNPPRVGPGESAQGMLRFEGSSGGFRYSEARIYPGDPLYALGDFTAEPWDAEDDEEDAGEPLAAEDAEDDGDDAEPWDGWSDLERLDGLYARAAALTPRRILRGSSQPFLLSTTPEEKLAEAQGLAWKAALGIAPLPGALAALLLWLRYG